MCQVNVLILPLLGLNLEQRKSSRKLRCQPGVLVRIRDTSNPKSRKENSFTKIQNSKRLFFENSHIVGALTEEKRDIEAKNVR